MSDHQLPDDLADWPDSPFELLGIDHNTDAKTARRAYVRLIRRFKPEHAPRHFQRIREAYETAQVYLNQRSWYAAWDESTENELEETTGEAVPYRIEDRNDEDSHDGDAKQKAATPENEQRLFAHDIETRSEAAWQLAIDGREQDAYVKLLALHNEHRGNAEVCLRLYWLLKLNPNLDDSHVPCDWLADGLHASRLKGPLRELYRRELVGCPAEARSDRCTRLLDCPSDPWQVVELIEWRWRAGNLQSDRIVQDLQRIRQSVVYDDQSSWGRLLILAAQHLAWNAPARDNPPLDQCLYEIEQLPHLHFELAAELDRLELLMDVVDQFPRIRIRDLSGERSSNEANNWLDLIRLSWTSSDDAIRPRVAALIEEIVYDSTALWRFDRLANQSPAAVDHVGALIESYFHSVDLEDVEERPWEDVERTVRRFFALRGNDYQSLRAKLLKFCIHEMLDPHTVITAIGSSWYSGEGWSAAIEQDVPLRTVYLAHRAYTCV